MKSEHSWIPYSTHLHSRCRDRSPCRWVSAELAAIACGTCNYPRYVDPFWTYFVTFVKMMKIWLTDLIDTDDRKGYTSFLACSGFVLYLGLSIKLHAALSNRFRLRHNCKQPYSLAGPGYSAWPWAARQPGRHSRRFLPIDVARVPEPRPDSNRIRCKCNRAVIPWRWRKRTCPPIAVWAREWSQHWPDKWVQWTQPTGRQRERRWRRVGTRKTVSNPWTPADRSYYTHMYISMYIGKLYYYTRRFSTSDSFFDSNSSNTIWILFCFGFCLGCYNYTLSKHTHTHAYYYKYT